MRRILLLATFLTIASPAYAVDANLQQALAQWQSLRDPDASGIVFSDGIRFLAEHPGWPDEKIIRIRTEAAALFERPDKGVMKGFCENVPPISGRGMFACFQAGAGDAAAQKNWLHQGWIQGDFNETEEQKILSQYGNQLTQADQLARMDRLLYERKIPAAKRMMPLVPAAKHPLYQARMAVIDHRSNAQALLKAVPVADKHDAGLLFDCTQAALAADKMDVLVKIVKLAPATVPYPDLWWPARNTAIRELIDGRDYNEALAVLAKHGELKGEALAEALWLKGWITLQYMHNAGEAYKEFHALYTQVGTPVSKARAAYWAARAALKNGNVDIAHEWLAKAAQHSTVFYGQLAQVMLNQDAPLDLPDTPTYSSQEKAAFDKDELVNVAKLMADNHDMQMRDRFLHHIATNATNPGRLVLTANLARELDGVSGGVKIAKLALRQQVVLIDAGWPRIDLPKNIGVEPALALAITRQESEFDVHAESAAKAHGLMQLLTATAKHIAARIEHPYHDNSLEDANENLILGTAYLGQIINGFDGSYILGIASYNAGPGTVRKWIAERGTPPKNVNGAVDWIESIPYGETRNYVQRVLENTQVYRGLLTPKAELKLDEDITR